jgi:hypothetical protein
MKKKIYSKLFFAILIILCVSVFTILQGYWALWKYRTAPSSVCLDCDIFSDLFFSSILPMVSLAILHLLNRLTKPRLTIKIFLSVMILIFCWTFIDTEIFNEREASWSTYTNIWAIGICLSFLPVTTFGIIFGLSYYFLNLKLN